MVDGSPAWKPQATLAEVTTSSRASSSPSRQAPKPSPRSALRSIEVTETYRSARTGLRERRDVVDHPDHRVTAGGRVVGQEDDRLPVRRHLHRTEHHALRG